MRIYLVRHGQSELNVNREVKFTTPDHAVPLTEKGHQQADGAAEFLVKHLMDESMKQSDTMRFRIWSSPYRRARETTEHLRQKFSEDPFFSEAPLANTRRFRYDVREHIMLCEQQFGLFDGVPDDQLELEFPREHKHYDLCEKHNGRFWARFPLGESRFDVACRIHQAFGTFHRDNDKHGINTIIVVCHGVTLRAFVMMWLHKSPEWFEEEPNPGNCAVRLLQDGEDKGYIFKGFPKNG